MYPILFEFGPITVFSLWLFIAVGFITGSYIFIKLAKRNRVRFTIVTDNSFVLFLWTLLISRFVFVILNYDLYFYLLRFQNIIKIFAIWDKGLSFWGAIFAWFIGIWYLSKKQDQSPLQLFDIITPSILFGMAVGNIGAFLEGINYGTPTELPWGMMFRNANVRYISNIHPTQLYAALYTLILAIGIMFVYKKTRNILPGFTTNAAVFALSILKFFEEFLRGDEIIKIFGLRSPQIMAFIAILISGYFLYKKYLQNIPETRFWRSWGKP